MATNQQTDTPTNLVLQMKQQGITEEQMQEYLKRQGYNEQQIYNAINQANIKGIVTEQEQPEYPQETPQQPIQEPPMPNYPETNEISQQNMQYQTTTDTQRIEEIAEGIIDEKWDELMKNVDKIVSWKETTEERMAKIEQSIKEIKENFDRLHKGILTKVGEYDKNMKEVGTDIKALETVFKKILPSFTENVAELSRITKRVKEQR